MFTQNNTQEPWFYAGPLPADSSGQPHSQEVSAEGNLLVTGGPWTPTAARIVFPRREPPHTGTDKHNPPNSVIRADNGIVVIVSFLQLRFTLMGDGKISPQAMRSLLLC